MKGSSTLKIIVFVLIIALSNCWDNTLDAWKDGLFILNWNINVLTQEVTFNMDVGTAGWIGIGFSKDGYMAESDMIMAYIDSNGKPNAFDMYATGRSLPPLDTALGGTSDLTNIQGSYSNKRTNISFTRKLSTTDKYDYKITQGQKVNVLVALRDTGNPSTENGVFATHTKMISIPTTLWSLGSDTQASISSNPSSYEIMKINISPFIISNKRTTYACQYFKIDEMLKSQKGYKTIPKLHAYKFEPVIKSKFVHHMIIYSCLSPKAYMEGIQDCLNSMDMYCTQPVALSGMSTSSMEMPPLAGYMWGVEYTQVVMLEMHYDNPDLITGEDTSGFNVYYTPQLRKYNMGTAILGYPENKIIIEPRKSSVALSDSCPSSCTSKWNPIGINIVFALLHGHNLLKKTRLEITNSTTGLTDSSTFKTDNYDFGSQYINILNTPMHIHPGDSFKMICDYNSSNTTELTVGGKGSNNEMCYAFVGYYPAEVGFNMCYGGACFLNPKEIIENSSNASDRLGLNIFSYLIFTILFVFYSW
jgi:hypothetical protein